MKEGTGSCTEKPTPKIPIHHLSILYLNRQQMERDHGGGNRCCENSDCKSLRQKAVVSHQISSHDSSTRLPQSNQHHCATQGASGYTSIMFLQLSTARARKPVSHACAVPSIVTPFTVDPAGHASQLCLSGSVGSRTTLESRKSPQARVCHTKPESLAASRRKSPQARVHHKAIAQGLVAALQALFTLHVCPETTTASHSTRRLQSQVI